MMNNNYKIFGLITSLLRSDNPPKISKNFSENVMKDISSNKIPSYTYNNYILLYNKKYSFLTRLGKQLAAMVAVL